MITFTDLVIYLLDSDYPFFIYRKPGDEIIRMGIQSDFTPHMIISDEIISCEGFIFHPYQVNNQNYIYRIKNDINIDFTNDHLYIESLPDKLTTGIIIKNELCENPDVVISKEHYIENCLKFIETIKHDGLDKAVLSRLVVSDKCNRKMAGEVFLKMTENYDSAYVSLVNIHCVGCWIGATPEKLLSYNNGNFKSVALASTRKNGLDCDPEWGQKEIDEQRYVTQYICRILDELNTVYNVSEPKTITAGNIQHLSTDFEGKIETVKLLQLINKLHPTPAVCGSPLKEAKKLINKTETHDRSYYSGFLGYVENSKNLDFFVNLRCARLRDKDCIIYVGGGVTAESDPEKEWEETKEKSQTILNLL